MRYITLTAIAPPWWEAPAGMTNEQLIERMMALWRAEIDAVLPEKPDLILLPEVCDRYANLSAEQNRAYYDARGDRMRDFFAGVARENGCCIAYSAVRQAEDGYFRNSTQLIGRTGRVEGIYNKNHLVVSEGPLDGPHPMLCGRDAVVSDLDFGRVGCAICFDLNFYELREKYMAKKPELLLFSSNYHGDFHQLEWAYDCRSYFACAVRNQEARVISPVGEVLAASTCYYHYVTARVNLDYAVCYLDFNWERFQAAREKYGAKIRIHDPGKTGAVLLTSETDEFSAMDVVREFGIELMDDYFERSRRDERGRVEP